MEHGVGETETFSQKNTLVFRERGGGRGVGGCPFTLGRLRYCSICNSDNI